MIDVWGPQGAVPWAESAAGTDGLGTMLDAIWRIDRPDTADVLAALGTHPDPILAKQARKLSSNTTREVDRGARQSVSLR